MKKPRKSRFPVILFLFAAAFASSAGLFRQEWKIGPEYEIDHVVKPGDLPGRGELTVSLRVPYDEILFVKNNAHYSGRFDISIMIFRDGEQRAGENWIEDLSLDEFNMTNSRENAFETRRYYELEPAEYRVEVLVTDLNTQNRRKRTMEVDMSRLAEGPWMMGDLYIVEEKVVKSGGDEMPEAIYIGFSAAGVAGTGTFTYTLLSGDEAVKQGKFDMELVARKHEYCFPVRTKDLNFNQYTLVLQAEVGDKKYERQMPVRVQWAGSNALIPNLNDAVEQMRYLSHTGYFPVREYRKAVNGGREEKKGFFTETWEKLDPSPDSERNELMNEYYYRVQTANRRFSGQREGWRSDRGMIYIIYGEPDAVEEHHMEIDTKPYIIWYYYSVNRRFIFVDYTGFGDYQLTEPLSEY